MKTPDISVVVCTYNRAALLTGALNSLICQETDGRFSYEILVIDDGSTDETSFILREVARSSQAPIRYVRERGLGIPHARNRGIKESSGEWVAFFDDDQLAEPNWLRELLKSASKLGTSCVGGSRKLYLSKQRYSELSPICKTILGEIKLGNEQLKYNGKNFPCTGNVLIKNTVFDTVGLFNELMKWGGSDLDFFRKARMAGIEAWYTPKAVVHHVIPSYRLSEDYLIWRSLLTGNNFAIINYREWGLVKTTLACIARMGQAVLVNMPLLFWTYLSGDDVERLGRKCLLCRAVGYMRQTVYLLAPGLFTQKRFLAQLEFRKERTSFLKESNLAENKYHKI